MEASIPREAIGRQTMIGLAQRARQRVKRAILRNVINNGLRSLICHVINLLALRLAQKFKIACG